MALTDVIFPAQPRLVPSDLEHPSSESPDRALPPELGSTGFHQAMVIKCNGVVSHGWESFECPGASVLARHSATFTGAGPEGSATLP